MVDQTEITSMSDLLSYLQTVTNDNSAITIEHIKHLLKKISGKITINELNELIKISSNQVGIWEAAWLFSPANSPNTDAKQKSQQWRKQWETWFGMLLEQVPDAREQAERIHQLTILKHHMSKGFDYNRNKPLKRLFSAGLSQIAIIFNRIGLNDIANNLYILALYPKGTVGRAGG